MTGLQHPIVPEDIIAFKHVGDVQVTPDGALIAFVVSDNFQERDRSPRSQIWVVPGAGGAARPFTTGEHSDTTPRWSPDGSALALLSDRAAPGKPQVYLIDRAGGEARRLTDLPGEISELEWSPDGRQLAFLMQDPETEAERQRKQAGDDAIAFEQHHKWQRVWALDLASGATRQVTDGDAQVWEFCWAPNGGFALVVGPEPYEWSWFVARLACVGPAGGVPQTTYQVPEKQLACPRVSPDGEQVAFLSCIWSDRGINAGDVLLMPASGGPARSLTEGYAGSVWWIAWTPDGAALDYLGYEGGDAALGRIDLATGQRVTRWRAPVAVEESFGAHYIARDTGAIAVVRSTPTLPPDVWYARPTNDQRPTTNGTRAASDDRRPTNDPEPTSDQHPQPGTLSAVLSTHCSERALEWQQLTQLHPRLAELALGETRVLRWHAADGLEIQGQLILPVGYQEGQRAPLITWVHGGPAWLYAQGLYPVQQALAGAGFAVLLANPRGSVGWGVPFTESNIGDFGGRDFADILAGIDHVVALGIADPQRLGIGGWSYGGFMSAWAITQCDRFKAAIVGAAITHWRSFHGVASIGTWDQISCRASPYEQGGYYDRYSPIHYVNNVTIPTLLLHGECDQIVPVGQSYEFFRALKDRGVTTELVVYPREGHPIREKAHNLHRLNHYVNWFKRFL